MKTGKKNTQSTYSRGEIAAAILSYCAIGIAIGAVLVCPNLAQLYAFFDSKSDADRLRIRRNIRKLQREGYISVPSSRNSPLKPTMRGMRKAEYESLHIKEQPIWDKKWRLCMFDIPETARISRVFFSAKVTKMGMKHYQKSIYLSPYPCEAELAKAAQQLRVQNHIKFVVATSISEEIGWKKQFSLN